jgi:hypothetical protein
MLCVPSQTPLKPFSWSQRPHYNRGSSNMSGLARFPFPPIPCRRSSCCKTTPPLMLITKEDASRDKGALLPPTAWLSV